MKTKNLKQSGTARICEAMISSALLFCRVSNVGSIVEKMKQITGEKFPITKYSGSDLPDTDPWIVELMIGDTKVVVQFIMKDTNLISEIHVIEETK